jgi:hypothetical protein
MYCQLPERAATRSAFSQPLDAVAFFDAACGYRPSGRCKPVGPRSPCQAAQSLNLQLQQHACTHSKLLSHQQPACPTLVAMCRSVEAFGAKLAYGSSRSSRQHGSTAKANAQQMQDQCPPNGSIHTGASATCCNGAPPAAVSGLKHANDVHVDAQRSASGAATTGHSTPEAVQQLEAEGLAALGLAVRYFVMGCRQALRLWPHLLPHNPFRIPCSMCKKMTGMMCQRT